MHLNQIQSSCSNKEVFSRNFVPERHQPWSQSRARDAQATPTRLFLWRVNCKDFVYELNLPVKGAFAKQREFDYNCCYSTCTSARVQLHFAKMRPVHCDF